MIIPQSTIRDFPIMSLQTGDTIARIAKPIIDPADLGVKAYYVNSDQFEASTHVLRTQDFRELSDLGFIVDSIDDLIELADVVKLKEIADLSFVVDGIPVIDENRHKLGKVTDYTIDTTTFTIQQLSVKRPLLKSFGDTELLIHRSQIIEVGRNSIVVHSHAKIPEPELGDVVKSYANPFRKAKTTSPESIDSAKG